ncbi:LysR family transcriptional regulator [Vandammella animalimorsus]|uniref:LysR family transcriptional regulator n=1 Tax=Vandammella animalimorsus TaxID=2029117 RepID=A0A2A2T8W3_9BURK|nr:LysR family transcriptional regulator [Vandammella animalimorsus]PAT33282.1 LysR family transcriptional regulator [Vandammella animalimorsus]PAX18480.1 LysR family transcriptional regulator [Vandammella animalimorsus]PAX20644.1 LysR family transcriptional regulator [Vandammella animalimorsus]
MDWDNLRFFLALARTGTLVNAARTVQVDHTTVSRRIQVLEKQMGVPLFAREASGHRLTEAGRHLLPQAEAMEAAFLSIESSSLVTQEGLSGLVRVGVPEGLGTQVLAAPLAELARQHPSLVIDLLALPRLVHLSRREADIVISLERPTRGSVVVTKLSDYVLRLYGARDYLAQHAPITSMDDLAEHTFISYVDDLLFSKQLQFLESFFQPQHFGLRSTSVLAQYQAVRAGAGLAILPAFIGDRDPALVQLLPQQAQFQRTFWMSMPAEIRHLARVQAVWQFLRDVARKPQSGLLPQPE